MTRALFLAVTVLALSSAFVLGGEYDEGSCGCASAGNPINDPITLKYWNGRGLMEVPRMLLAIAGKYPGDYTDGRFNEPADELTANLGRMPMLQLGDDVHIGQSAAMNFYLASSFGLMGESTLEAAQILSIAEHLVEVKAAYRSVVPYKTEPTSEMLDTWFNGGFKDVSGTADYSGRGQRYASWFMGRIEATLGDKGFAVGDKLSLADVLIYNMFAEHLTEEEGPDKALWQRGAFGSKELTDAAVKKHPKLSASIDAVTAHPNVQKWLSTRGVQGF